MLVEQSKDMLPGMTLKLVVVEIEMTDTGSLSLIDNPEHFSDRALREKDFLGYLAQAWIHYWHFKVKREH